MIEESHQSLVDALLELEKEGVCEVQIVRMENVGLREQVRLVARSAVSLCSRLSLSRYSLLGSFYLFGEKAEAGQRSGLGC